jgi:thiamine-phosphate diphosphorylase/hydroxyethylthiazole kinase
MQQLANKGYAHVPVVCIGGINISNIASVLHEGSYDPNPLSGAAVVSAVMAAGHPEAAAVELRHLVVVSLDLDESRDDQRGREGAFKTTTELLGLVPKAIKMVHDKKPLSHNMTNLVSPSPDRHPPSA